MLHIRVLVSLLLIAHCVAQQQVLSVDAGKRAITPEISDLGDKLVKEGKIPGLSIGVVHSNGTVETKTWGIKTENGDAMTPDTLFHIASCSKAFLSASLGILMDDFVHGRNHTALPAGVSRFDWHTRIIGLLPDDWQLMDDWASEKATVRDVLSHQSGLPRHDFSYRRTDTALDVIRRMKDLRPAFELRQRFHYTNTMYMLGAHLISTFSGQRYVDFVRERIFGPLNMSSSTFNPTKAAEDGKETQCWDNNRRIPVWLPEDDGADLLAGPGGVITNTVDMTKWLHLLLNHGRHPATNATVIPRAVFDEVTAAHAIVQGQAAQPHFSIQTYGMGWDQQSYQGHQSVMHSGEIPGFSSVVTFWPNSDIATVLLANAGAKHQYELALTYRIFEDFLGLRRLESERLIDALQSDAANKANSGPSFARAPPTPLSLPLVEYAGTYYDPGYGNLSLCPPTSHPSNACAPVLSPWSYFENVSDTSAPVLYATLSSIWATNARLAHRDREVFSLSATGLFPHGFGKNKAPFMLEDIDSDETPLTVEFWVEEGRVLGAAVNGFVGESTERKREGGSLMETAEVWLQKVA